MGWRNSTASAPKPAAAERPWREFGNSEPDTCPYCGTVSPKKCSEEPHSRMRFWYADAHECEGTRRAADEEREEWIQAKIAELDNPTEETIRRVKRECHLPARCLPGLRALTVSPTNREAIKAARAMVNRFGSRKRERGLYLYGGLGTGKTCILSALAFELRHGTGRHGRSEQTRDGWQYRTLIDWGPQASVQFWPVPDLFAAIKRGMDKAGTYDADAVEQCQALLLDDVGKQYDTPWVVSELFRLVNNRYNALLSTSFTSNHSPGELGARMVGSLGVDYASDIAAMVDRIEETCDVVEIKGKSWRQKGVAS